MDVICVFCPDYSKKGREELTNMKKMHITFKKRFATGLHDFIFSFFSR